MKKARLKTVAAKADQISTVIHFLVFFGVSLLSGLIIFWQASVANAEIDRLNQATLLALFTDPITNVPGQRYEKSPQQTVKGVYLTAYSANNAAKMDEIIKLIDETELNAVVIDIKDYSGYVLYDSSVPLVDELKTERHSVNDIPGLIKKLHEHKIYAIARQTVFQDPILARNKPEWSVRTRGGGIWLDNKGLSWVDPTKKEVWDYNLAIAKEAVALGFDEINFDYIRFPSDGPIKLAVYSSTTPRKYETMGKFYQYVSEQLASEPAWISFDMFGFVMEKKGSDDMNIGQRLADAVDYADYVCPMMYPSHYPSGHLGLKNPAAFPALVIEHGLKKGMPAVKDKRAQIRPWIQAFNMGAVYDGGKIRAEIDTVEKYTSAGWLMWNASNRYAKAGLKEE